VKEVRPISYVRSDDLTMCRGCEAGRSPGYSIDSENEVMINSPLAYPLGMEPAAHYVAEVAASMINKMYQPGFMEVGR